MFKLHSEYKPTGDQPKAIDYLVKGIERGEKYQTHLTFWPVCRMRLRPKDR